MKEGNVFVDTNVIVYAYDVSAGEKHRKAVKLMSVLWHDGRGMVSTQVLQEFFVTVTKKIPNPLNAVDARGIIRDFLKWKTVIVDGEIILHAIDIAIEHQYSFWDSMIISAALEGGAKTLLSEDLSDKHTLKGMLIRNPFAAV